MLWTCLLVICDVYAANITVYGVCSAYVMGVLAGHVIWHVCCPYVMCMLPILQFMVCALPMYVMGVLAGHM